MIVHNGMEFDVSKACVCTLIPVESCSYVILSLVSLEVASLYWYAILSVTILLYL